MWVGQVLLEESIPLAAAALMLAAAAVPFAPIPALGAFVVNAFPITAATATPVQDIEIFKTTDQGCPRVR